uniref:Coat protein n=1 Tax=Datura ophiovirus TaxID=2983939 RepID=A0A9N7ABF4_9VIRU|nr:TPA_asm: coat protein [Datura ophiovirus]
MAGKDRVFNPEEIFPLADRVNNKGATPTPEEEALLDAAGIGPNCEQITTNMFRLKKCLDDKKMFSVIDGQICPYEQKTTNWTKTTSAPSRKSVLTGRISAKEQSHLQLSLGEDADSVLAELRKTGSSSKGHTSKEVTEPEKTLKDDESEEEGSESFEDLEDKEEMKITNHDEFEKALEKSSFIVDAKRIQEHLEKFIKTIGTESETYQENDLVIKYFKDTDYKSPDCSVSELVGAGTKILDAIVFCSMIEPDKEPVGIFRMMKIEKLTSTDVSRNIMLGKQALLAGMILVYVQGSLPNAAENKTVPKFIKDYVYNSNRVTMGSIAGDLSRTSTRKFPQNVFLNIDLNILPVAIASRCKLAIAGNRAVRYAVCASGFRKAEPLKPTKNDSAEVLMMIMDRNKRLEHASNLVEYIKSLQGDVKKQIKMHPLHPKRPVVQNFTKKLTRAILETLSVEGRKDLHKKILSDNNSGFMRDKDFFGETHGNKVVHEVLNDDTADYSDMSVAMLKGIFE